MKNLGIALFIFAGLSACTAAREQEVEGDINEFRSWVNAQTGQLEERTEEDWRHTKAEFERRTQELDRKQERLTERLRDDYRQIKENFKEREREREAMAERRTRLSQWERDLLGSYADRSSLTSGNIRQAYAALLDNVRNRHQNWSQEDWEMAHLVLAELNERKDALGELPDEEEVQIKALQMEFAALEAGDESGGN